MVILKEDDFLWLFDDQGLAGSVGDQARGVEYCQLLHLFFVANKSYKCKVEENIYNQWTLIIISKIVCVLQKGTDIGQWKVDGRCRWRKIDLFYVTRTLIKRWRTNGGWNNSWK